jgi:ribonucleoside-diphosphate reductase alpha chain
MLAAVQPFISGAASKTINLPESATPQDIRECFELAWRLGVKCIAVYRNNSKVRQVLSSKPKEVMVPAQNSAPHPSIDYSDEIEKMVSSPVRRRLPRTRSSITHKIHVRGHLGEHEGYVTVGTYSDGMLGEMFLEGFGRLGGFTQNVLSAWATSVSVGLQYGVPLEVLMRKHVGHCDETGGIVVPSPEEPLVIRSCDSIIDYIARWVISQFGSVDLQEELGVMTDAVKARKMVEIEVGKGELIIPLSSNGNGHAASVEMGAMSCAECHKPMRRTGACWTCVCGFSSGGCG